jgi:hypothetical protein
MFDPKICNLCDNNVLREQIRYFDESGTKKLDVPIRVDKPFCLHFGLHHGWLERLHKLQRGPCKHFVRDGMS